MPSDEVVRWCDAPRDSRRSAGLEPASRHQRSRHGRPSSGKGLVRRWRVLTLNYDPRTTCGKSPYTPDGALRVGLKGFEPVSSRLPVDNPRPAARQAGKKWQGYSALSAELQARDAFVLMNVGRVSSTDHRRGGTRHARPRESRFA